MNQFQGAGGSWKAAKRERAGRAMSTQKFEEWQTLSQSWPIGAKVSVQKEDGTTFETTTASFPTFLRGEWMVIVRQGCVLWPLSRVEILALPLFPGSEK